MRTSVEGDIHVRTRATTESAYLDRTHNDVCLDTGQAPPGTHNAPKVGHLVLEDPAFEWELPMEHVSERLHTADTLGSTHAERSPEHEKGRDDRDSELGYVQERHEPRSSQKGDGAAGKQCLERRAAILFPLRLSLGRDHQR